MYKANCSLSNFKDEESQLVSYFDSDTNQETWYDTWYFSENCLKYSTVQQTVQRNEILQQVYQDLITGVKMLFTFCYFMQTIVKKELTDKILDFNEMFLNINR